MVVIGSFLKDKTNDIADNFAFKHHYITGAMDSEVLCTILEAIHEKRNVTVEMLHRRKNRVTESNVVPLPDNDQCAEWKAIYDGLCPIF